MKAKHKEATRINKEHEEKEALLEGQLKAAEVARTDLIKLHNKKIQKMQKETQQIKADNEAVEKELQTDKERLRERLSSLRDKNKNLVTKNAEVINNWHPSFSLRASNYNLLYKIVQRNALLEDEIKRTNDEFLQVKEKTQQRERQLQGSLIPLLYYCISIFINTLPKQIERVEAITQSGQANWDRAKQMRQQRNEKIKDGNPLIYF